MSDEIELDQEDFGARLAADPYFADIKVLVQRKGVTEQDIETALSVLNEQGGKIGACVIVLMPSLVPPANNSAPTPLFDVRIGVQVIEQPLISQDPTSGVGKSAEQICTRVRQNGHQFSTGRQGANQLFSFDGTEPADVEAGKVSYVNFFKRKAGDAHLVRVAPVALAKAAGTPDGFDITLSCPTDGAAILYSVDGSYPTTAYTVPFNVAAGVTVRAAATKTGLQQSNVTELTA